MLRDAISKLAKHSAIYGIAEQLGYLSSFLLITVHTSEEGMSASEYGVWELLGPSIAILTSLLGINMYNAMTRYYFEREEGAARHELVSTTLISVFASSSIVGLLLYIFSSEVTAFFATSYPGMQFLVELSIGILILRMVKEVLFKYLQVENRSVTYAVIRVGKLALEIALQLHFLLNMGLGVEAVFLAMIIGEAASALVLIVLVLPRVGLRFSKTSFALLAAFTLPLIPNGMLQWVLHNADRYMLQWIVNEEAVGTYGAAYKLGSIPNYLVMSPFLLIWYPYVFGLKKLDIQRELVGKLMPYFMLLMSAVVLGVALVGEDLAFILIERESFDGTGSAIPWVCLGYWFWGLFQILQTGLYVQKRTGILPQLTGIAAVINIGLNLVLIPQFSFLGAAATTTLTFAALCFLCERRARAIFEVDWPWRRCWSPAIAAGLTYSIALLIPLSPGVGSALCRFGVWLIWVAWIWRGFLTVEEREAGLDALRSAIGRVRNFAG